MARATAADAILVTGDKDFASIVRFPPSSHSGIVVLRVPNELTVEVLQKRLLRALTELRDIPMGGRLMIVEMGRIRLRPPAGQQST